MTNAIDALAAWDTPALSNALDALGLRPRGTGHTDGSVRRVTGTAPMVGRAVTARMAAREPCEDGISVARLHRAIAEQDGPVVVVLEDVDDPVAGMTVRPGDLLHGDEHGVLHIPAEAVPGILEQAETIRAEEQNIVAWSRSDDFSVEKLLRLRRVRH